LAATNRPTSRNRIGSDGKALQSSLRGEDFDCGWVMKRTLHKMPFCATYEARPFAHGRRSLLTKGSLCCDDIHARTCSPQAVAHFTGQ
jgi:hypothetical protein